GCPAARRRRDRGRAFAHRGGYGRRVAVELTLPQGRSSASPLGTWLAFCPSLPLSTIEQYFLDSMPCLFGCCSPSEAVTELPRSVIKIGLPAWHCPDLVLC